MRRHSLGTSQSNLRTNAVDVALSTHLREPKTPWIRAAYRRKSRAASSDRSRNIAVNWKLGWIAVDDDAVVDEFNLQRRDPSPRSSNDLVCDGLCSFHQQRLAILFRGHGNIPVASACGRCYLRSRALGGPS
jgi:hypothetical protein